MRRTMFFICFIVFALSLSCQRMPQKMTILTEDYPPITFAVGDSISGYATDVVRAIQGKIGSNNEIVLSNWTEAYERALAEKNLVLFSMEQTPARKELFNWIGPLGHHTSSLYVAKDKAYSIGSIEDAKELKMIATTTSWFTEQYLMDNGFTNLLSSPKPSDNVTNVIDGNAEATILSDLVAQDIITGAGYDADALIPIFEVIKSDYYIAISKSTSPQTVSMWEKAFQELSADGTIDAIKARWFK